MLQQERVSYFLDEFTYRSGVKSCSDGGGDDDDDYDYQCITAAE